MSRDLCRIWTHYLNASKVADIPVILCLVIHPMMKNFCHVTLNSWWAAHFSWPGLLVCAIGSFAPLLYEWRSLRNKDHFLYKYNPRRYFYVQARVIVIVNSDPVFSHGQGLYYRQIVI